MNKRDFEKFVRSKLLQVKRRPHRNASFLAGQIKALTDILNALVPKYTGPKPMMLEEALQASSIYRVMLTPTKRMICHCKSYGKSGGCTHINHVDKILEAQFHLVSRRE